MEEGVLDRSEDPDIFSISWKARLFSFIWLNHILLSTGMKILKASLAYLPS